MRKIDELNSDVKEKLLHLATLISNKMPEDRRKPPEVIAEEIYPIIERIVDEK